MFLPPGGENGGKGEEKTVPEYIPVGLFHLNPYILGKKYTSVLNQPINQSNFYSANIPGESKSVFKSKIYETVPWHQQTVGCVGV